MMFITFLRLKKKKLLKNFSKGYIFKGCNRYKPATWD
jgi:hypothetical protein